MSTEKMLEKILNKVESMDGRIVSIDSKIESMDSKIKSMDDKIVSMDSKINSMDEKIVSIDAKIESMDARIDNIEGQLTENTSILRALEHANEVHKAELDRLNIQVAKLLGNEEKIEKIEEDLKNHNHDIVIHSNKANVS